MLARRDTRFEAARLRRFSPLQALEDQSQTWGRRCHSCTRREGLAPSWPLSCKVHHDLAVCPEAIVSFRPTDRTYASFPYILNRFTMEEKAHDHRSDPQ